MVLSSCWCLDVSRLWLSLPAHQQSVYTHTHTHTVVTYRAAIHNGSCLAADKKNGCKSAKGDGFECLPAYSDADPKLKVTAVRYLCAQLFIGGAVFGARVHEMSVWAVCEHVSRHVCKHVFRLHRQVHMGIVHAHTH